MKNYSSNAIRQTGDTAKILCTLSILPTHRWETNNSDKFARRVKANPDHQGASRAVFPAHSHFQCDTKLQLSWFVSQSSLINSERSSHLICLQI